MNQHTASETAAALELQAHAALLVAGYAKPEDAEVSRLAVLMIAAQQEARASESRSLVLHDNDPLIMAAPELQEFAERVARLNPKAGEICPGMLAQLIDEARRVSSFVTPFSHEVQE